MVGVAGFEPTTPCPPDKIYSEKLSIKIDHLAWIN